MKKINIYIVKNNLDREQSEKLLQIYRPDKSMKYRQITNVISSVLTEIILKKHLFEVHGNDKLTVKYSVYDGTSKPKINFPNFHFSNSHSEKYIVVATSSTPIGIDVEEVKSVEYKDIINNYFSRNEIQYINMYPDKSRERFYELWTIKESYMKYTGKGIGDILNTKDIVSLNIDNTYQTALLCSFFCIFKHKDFKISLCSSINTEPYVIYSDAKSLLSFVKEHL